MTNFKRLSLLAATLGLSLSLNGQLHAEVLPESQAAFNAGLSAYQAGDIATAVTDWTDAAKGGHVGAAWILGNLYDSGKGVPQSDAKAHNYYLQAAKGGQPDAATRIGLIYLNGKKSIDVKPDYSVAIRMFEIGALAAKADAQFYLAMMYYRGQGVAVDRTEGLRWLLLSAKKRYSPTFAELGRIYMEGLGVSKDTVQGWAYLMLANRFATNDDQRGTSVDAMNKYDGWMQASEKQAAARKADEWLASHKNG
ncbi:MAG: hypothetical protein GC184_12255 [Rhizobiales bacterium]|nr:hypothetical protein [Hyphomicrobiales bacterium]